MRQDKIHDKRVGERGRRAGNGRAGLSTRHKGRRVEKGEGRGREAKGKEKGRVERMEGWDV